MTRSRPLFLAFALLAAGPSRVAYAQPAPATAAPVGAQPDALPPPPELPKPLVIDDPMLVAPPESPRTIASWDDALALVRQQSPDYVAGLQSVLRAEAQTRLALSQLLPTVNGAVSYTHQFLTESFSLSTTGAGPTFQSPAADVFGLAATLNVPLVNVRGIYAQSTAKRAAEAAKGTFEDTRRQIAVSLVHSMLATLASERASELNRVGLRAALERLELARTKVRFRQGTALDVERAEQDVASARSTLITGDESLLRSREALGVALGSGVAVSAPVSLGLDSFEQAVARSCKMSTELENRPDVVAARKRVEVAERTVKDAWLMLAPSLAVQSQVAYTSEAVLAPNTTWYVEGVLNIPIYDGGLAASTARDARGAAEQARQTLASTRLNALVNVAQSQRAVSVIAATRDVAKTQRDLAKSIDARTREGYLHGLGTSLDLVTSAQSLRQAEINLALLEFQVSEARANAVLANAECKY
jgi:multidrug efflux system outer membrane protein